MNGYEDENMSISFNDISRDGKEILEEDMDLHDDLMNLVKESGMEKFATEIGLIENGVLQNFYGENDIRDVLSMTQQNKAQS